MPNQRDLCAILFQKVHCALVGFYRDVHGALGAKDMGGICCSYPGVPACAYNQVEGP